MGWPASLRYSKQKVAEQHVACYGTSMTGAASLGQWVRAQRIARGMTARELAAVTGLSSFHLSRLEHDHVRPGHRTLRDIAQALGVDESTESTWREHLESAQAVRTCTCGCESIDTAKRDSLRRPGRNDHARRIRERVQCPQCAGIDNPGSSQSNLSSVPSEVLARLASGLAKEFRLRPKDVDGVFRFLERLGSLSSLERAAVLRIIAPQDSSPATRQSVHDSRGWAGAANPAHEQQP